MIDADVIARQVVEPGTPALAALVERFGADILGPDGRLDRPALAERAFVDDETRKELEAITHPGDRRGVPPPGRRGAGRRGRRARRAAARGVEAAGLEYAAVIVVEAPREVRLDRLEARGVARDDAERRMALQATDEERRAVATWVRRQLRRPRRRSQRQVDEIWAEL